MGVRVVKVTAAFSILVLCPALVSADPPATTATPKMADSCKSDPAAKGLRICSLVWFMQAASPPKPPTTSSAAQPISPCSVINPYYSYCGTDGLTVSEDVLPGTKGEGRTLYWFTFTWKIPTANEWADYVSCKFELLNVLSVGGHRNSSSGSWGRIYAPPYSPPVDWKHEVVFKMRVEGPDLGEGDTVRIDRFTHKLVHKDDYAATLKLGLCGPDHP